MFNRNNARCVDCGFLARRCEVDIDGKPTKDIIAFHHWGLTELPAALRNPLNLNKSGALCEKGVIDMLGMDAGTLAAEIEKRRRCTWYEPNADLSFAQHALSRHDRREFQRRVLLDRVVFAVIGAAFVAIVTQALAGFPFGLFP